MTLDRRDERGQCCLSPGLGEITQSLTVNYHVSSGCFLDVFLRSLFSSFSFVLQVGSLILTYIC